MKFEELVKEQFVYGGQKYAHNQTREATDILFEAHGKNWLFGTIDKYTFRYRNLKRERDLLKIACYQYILWLKRGYFIMESGIIAPPIDTNVKIKEQYFADFITRYEQKKHQIKEYGRDNVELIHEILVNLSHVTWEELTEMDLFTIFYHAEQEWMENYANAAKHDTDCYNGNGK